MQGILKQRLNNFLNFLECEVVGIDFEVILSNWNFIHVKSWVGIEEFFKEFGPFV